MSARPHAETIAGENVYLKSLTLRGFKSFASATTLQFEPGITAVVGPNGSGKSNVVDAIAWVMGEQGAKSLRGGKMEDVIFAGTPDRAPLGRAEVVLTIDNSDGALPIDFSEVTISRTLFRTGGSEYAINGEPARLLDVQELLSDSGIGREMHVIVGQGRLDSILKATPDDRRGFVEEAAGVLKHRKRKEKALRKLDAMSANLTRLQDLTHELRRQLKPLGRQAEVARRAQVIQSDVRDAALRLLADDLVTLQQALDREEADEAALIARRTSLQEQLDNARAQEVTVEHNMGANATELARASELHTRLTALRERYRGLVALARERAAYLDESDTAVSSGTDPDTLEAHAHAAEQEAKDIESELAELIAQHELAVENEKLATEHVETARHAAAEHARQVAAHRERVVRATARVESLTQKLDGCHADMHRREQRVAEIGEQLSELRTQRQSMNAEPATDADALAKLEQASVEAKAAVEEAKARVSAVRSASEHAQRKVVELSARLDALLLSQKSGSAEVLANIAMPGLGAVAGHIRVEPGNETAIEAALTYLVDADAVAVADLAAAIRAIEALREANVGAASLLIAGELATRPRIDIASDAAQLAADLVSPSSSDVASESVTAGVRSLLGRTVVVADIAHAQALLTAEPSLTVVSLAGDIVTARSARGGYDVSSDLAIGNEIAKTIEQLEEARPVAAETSEQLVEAEQLFEDATRRARTTADEFAQARNEAVEANAQVSMVESQIAAGETELARVRNLLTQATEQIRAASGELDDQRRQLAELHEQAPTPPAVSDEETQQLQADAAVAREAVTTALLAVRASQQRRDALLTRSDELRRSARREREARAAALEAAAQRKRQAEQAIAVLAVADSALTELDRAVDQSNSRRLHFQSHGSDLSRELAELRPQIAQFGEQIAALTSDVHADEVARAEQRMRVGQLHEKALEDFGVGPEELLADYGPDQLVPPTPPAPGDEVDPAAPAPEPYPFVREEQEKRFRGAQKAMALLGRVNPLALEEFAAMEERYAFLNKQLEDLKGSRKDLLDIVEEVDARIQQVFAEAYADVAREFEGVFSRLFPGGEGRLVLTDPDNLLTTGIEVEARPAGKRIKRLSLLSGGERSLTAVAFLVSLFKARPSPFYIMDEVEAALDDVNLGRLIGLMQELQGSSQLLIITHQKRTMEIADALYGVTMKGGVTTVISQRVRELATAQS